MKSIMFYINSLGKGGAERVIIQLANHFQSKGYESIIVTTVISDNEYEIGPNIKRIALEDNSDAYNTNKFIRNIRRIKLLRNVIKEYNPCVVVSFMAEPNVRNIFACMGLNTKSLISVRNDPKVEYAGTSGKFIARWILPLADMCVFQTPDAQNSFTKRLIMKSEVIANAVNPVFFNIERQHFGGKNVVTVGRLEPQKNQEMLIDAFEQVVKTEKEAKLYIYGDGSLKAKLQEKINILKLEENIYLMGTTNEVEKVLSEADVFVLASDYEGMPNALMEALACGVPSISTDCPCGGPRYLIEDGVNGLLISVGDCNSLKELICTLISNSEMSNALSINAKQMSEGFKPEVVFSKWAKFIEGNID